MVEDGQKFHWIKLNAFEQYGMVYVSADGSFKNFNHHYSYKWIEILNRLWCFINFHKKGAIFGQKLIMVKSRYMAISDNVAETCTVWIISILGWSTKLLLYYYIMMVSMISPVLYW